MNKEQQRLLVTMKKLIREGKRKFSNRKDRNIVDDLLDFEITVDEAWKIILTLNCNFFFNDPRPNYNSSNNVLIFKKTIKGKIAYIKLSLDYDDSGDIVVCLSFHVDNKRVKK